jgi:hypothetical protein
VTIRSEPIPPPDPPDERMRGRLVAAFDRNPRIIEAWLTGERLLPEEGSPAWDSTNIELVLDPPLAQEAPENLRREIEALEQELEPVGFRRDPDRAWTYSHRNAIRWTRRHATQIYPLDR